MVERGEGERINLSRPFGRLRSSTNTSKWYPRTQKKESLYSTVLVRGTILNAVPPILTPLPPTTLTPSQQTGSKLPLHGTLLGGLVRGDIGAQTGDVAK